MTLLLGVPDEVPLLLEDKPFTANPTNSGLFLVLDIVSQVWEMVISLEWRPIHPIHDLVRFRKGLSIDMEFKK